MKKSNIIFDIDGVLFTQNKLLIARQSGLFKIIWYLLSHRKNPVKIGLDIFKQMHELEKQKGKIVYKQQIMPDCITQWMKGIITNKALMEKIDIFIEQLKKINYFTSEFEKNFIKKSIKIILDETQFAKNVKPIHPMLKLVETLKKDGRHNLFIISNYAKQAAEILLDQYQSFFALFDDIIISANIGMIKPDKEIFHHLLNKHKLEPEKCVFIDDLQENIHSAKDLGINGILYNNFGDVKHKLEKLNIF